MFPAALDYCAVITWSMDLKHCATLSPSETSSTVILLRSWFHSLIPGSVVVDAFRCNHIIGPQHLYQHFGSAQSEGHFPREACFHSHNRYYNSAATKSRLSSTGSRRCWVWTSPSCFLWWLPSNPNSHFSKRQFVFQGLPSHSGPICW